MASKKAQAKILAIRHFRVEAAEAPVFEVLDDFRRFLRQGKTLFIENGALSIEELQNHRRIGSYETLVQEATKHGMKVVALDTPLISRVARPLSRNATDFNYRNTSLRERKWAIILQNSEEGDIAVMHPNHAQRMARRLGIDKKRVAWLHQPEPEYFSRLKRNLHWKKVKVWRQKRDREREQRRKLKTPKPK